MNFQVNTMRRFLRRTGMKRVSDDAAKEFGRLLERYSREIAEEALAIAEQSRRKTVRGSDIRAAKK